MLVQPFQLGFMAEGGQSKGTKRKAWTLCPYHGDEAPALNMSPQMKYKLSKSQKPKDIERVAEYNALADRRQLYAQGQCVACSGEDDNQDSAKPAVASSHIASAPSESLEGAVNPVQAEAPEIVTLPDEPLSTKSSGASRFCPRHVHLLPELDKSQKQKVKQRFDKYGLEADKQWLEDYEETKGERMNLIKGNCLACKREAKAFQLNF
jgi:hypothetical protein